MKQMIENLINGNISTARKQAKRYSLVAIKDACILDFGFSVVKAWAAASFLKTGEGWQQYCDAE